MMNRYALYCKAQTKKSGQGIIDAPGGAYITFNGGMGMPESMIFNNNEREGVSTNNRRAAGANANELPLQGLSKPCWKYSFDEVSKLLTPESAEFTKERN